MHCTIYQSAKFKHLRWKYRQSNPFKCFFFSKMNLIFGLQTTFDHYNKLFTFKKEVKNEIKNYKWDKRKPIKSLSKLNKLIKKADGTYKQYSKDIRSIKNDLKTVKNVTKNIDKWIDYWSKESKDRTGIEVVCL